MKKFGFATIVASGLAAAVLGLAGPAQADIGHHRLGARHPTACHRRLGHPDLRQRPLTHNLDRKGRPHKGAPSSHLLQQCSVTTEAGA